MAGHVERGTVFTGIVSTILKLTFQIGTGLRTMSPYVGFGIARAYEGGFSPPLGRVGLPPPPLEYAKGIYATGIVRCTTGGRMRVIINCILVRSMQMIIINICLAWDAHSHQYGALLGRVCHWHVAPHCDNLRHQYDAMRHPCDDLRHTDGRADCRLFLQTQWIQWVRDIGTIAASCMAWRTQSPPSINPMEQTMEKLHIPQQTITLTTKPDAGAKVAVETTITIKAGDLTADDVAYMLTTTTSPIVRWQASARRSDDGIPKTATIELIEWVRGGGRKVRTVEKPLTLEQMREKAKVDPAYKEMLRKALEG